MRFACMVTFVHFVVVSSSSEKKTNYDELTARQLLNLAAAAYGDQHDSCIKQTYPSSQDYKTLSVGKETCDIYNNACEGFIVSSDVTKHLVIVFRGTRTTSQLFLQAILALPTWSDFFGMGKVHPYFNNGLRVLWPPIEEALKDPKHADYNVMFTGHSLGGALATLAVARVVKQGLRPASKVKLYTFGQPRVGDKTFASNFDSLISESYRVVFRRDPVPHLPPCGKSRVVLDGTSLPCDPTALTKPYHQGTEIWYPDSMEHGSKYVECVGEPRGEDFSCSDRYKFSIDQTNSSLFEHLYYFDVKISHYGQSGCDVNKREKPPTSFDKLKCLILRKCGAYADKKPVVPPDVLTSN